MRELSSLALARLTRAMCRRPTAPHDHRGKGVDDGARHSERSRHPDLGLGGPVMPSEPASGVARNDVFVPQAQDVELTPVGTERIQHLVATLRRQTLQPLRHVLGDGKRHL